MHYYFYCIVCTCIILLYTQTLVTFISKMMHLFSLLSMMCLDSPAMYLFALDSQQI